MDEWLLGALTGTLVGLLAALVAWWLTGAQREQPVPDRALVLEASHCLSFAVAVRLGLVGLRAAAERGDTGAAARHLAEIAQMANCAEQRLLVALEPYLDDADAVVLEVESGAHTT